LSGIFWTSGDAGKGKTMLALHLVEVLKKKPSAGNVIHFFCSREHRRNDGISILRALIYQLLIQQPGLFDHIADIYDKHGSNLFSDNKFQPLWTILDRMVRDEHLESVSCILDGLDECNEDSLSDFWMKIRMMFQSGARSDHRLRLIVVSRNHPYTIQQALDGFLRVRLEPDNSAHIKRDIYKFIDERMSTLRCPSETRSYIRQKLFDRSEGTYLWIGFAINSLKKVRVIDMEKTVDAFPKGLEAIYRRMFLAISGSERTRVMEILRWVLTALRPLSLQELARGQSLEDAIADEVAYAGDLLIIVGSKSSTSSTRATKTVAPVHSSVSDFFYGISEHDADLTGFRLKVPTSHDHLARRLFDYTYLALQTAPSNFNNGMEFWLIERPREFDHVLLEYALSFGLQHLLRIGNVHLIDGYHPLLDTAHAYNPVWLQRQCLVVGRHYSRGPVTIAHLAALSGLLDAVKYIVDDQHTDLEIRDGGGRTLLFYATLNSYTYVVEWLLNQGADPNAQDITAQTPLHIATSPGHPSMVNLLLRKGARVNIQSSTQLIHSMLYEASQEDDGTTISRWSGTPVHIAAGHESSDIFSPLLSSFLQEGGNINAVDGTGRTMLHLLANLQEGDARADWDALERLSKTTSAIDASRLDNGGEAALHIVAKHCCSGVGPVFFDTFYEDPNSEEPLWNPVIALLESFWTPVDIQTAGGVTPLYLACQKGIPSFVDYLLAQGANARVRDNSGQTVLHWLEKQCQYHDSRRNA
jgi:ankyrin repeat protein